MAKETVYDEIGISGLTQYSGRLDEEKLRQLRGQQAMRTYREMSDNDPTIGAFLFLFEMLLRTVDWRVEAFSEDEEDKANAEFLESCMNDMSHSWEANMSEILSMLTFGWSSLELCYKLRLGPDQEDPTKRSKYSDGKIGWRKMPVRACETLDHWEFDSDGGIQGWWQQPPNGGSLIFLPITKLLMFRTTSRKNNPEGRSLLRSAYVPWYRKKELERIESIGAERDLAGLPMLYLDAKIMADKTEKGLAVMEAYKKILRDIRQDEQSSMIFPAVFDASGHRMVEFSLIGTGSRRASTIGPSIERYTKAILTSVMADLLVLGQGSVGSFALASSKTNTFAIAIGAFLKDISGVYNRFAVPRLWDLNGLPMDRMPKIVPGDIEKQNMNEFADAVIKLASAQGIHLGGKKDEAYLRSMMGLPEYEEPEPGMDASGNPLPVEPVVAEEKVLPVGAEEKLPSAEKVPPQFVQKVLERIEKRKDPKFLESVKKFFKVP